MLCFNHDSGILIRSDDAQLYVEEIGNLDAPALILLHGGFGSIADFNTITPLLSSHFRLIGIDTRGHGRSTLGKRKLTYPLLAEDLKNVIAKLGLPKYNIMGFSDGGIVSYHFASRNNPNIDKLVSIGASWEMNKDSPEFENYSGITEHVWKEMFPESYNNYMQLNPEAHWGHFSDNVVSMWTNLEDNNYPDDIIKNINSDVLVIRGDNDPLTTLESIYRQKKIMKSMHFLNIPFAEHAAYEDQPEIFLNALNRFFEVNIVPNNG